MKTAMQQYPHAPVNTLIESVQRTVFTCRPDLYRTFPTLSLLNLPIHQIYSKTIPLSTSVFFGAGGCFLRSEG